MTPHEIIASGGDIDSRPRRLLEQYVSLVGGTITPRADSLVDVQLPKTEQRYFGKVLQFPVAYNPDALSDVAGAQILVNGSELLRTLINAVQHRGSLRASGVVDATLASSNGTSAPPVRLVNATITAAAAMDVPRSIGRLLARITLHAGPTLLERLVETAMVDLSSGAEVQFAEADLRVADTSLNEPSAFGIQLDGDVDRVLSLLFDDLAKIATADIARVQNEASLALSSELSRLNAYYERMIAEVEDSVSDEDAKDRKAAIRADRDRRRKEEEYRFTVRIDVHPIQITQWQLPAEEVQWNLQSTHAKLSTLSASRFLLGTGEWQLTCPTCGAAPESICVCAASHTTCNNCSSVCTVCAEACCQPHGARMCEIDPHDLCAKHALECRCCDRIYCETHSARCELNDHLVCTGCAVACARCRIAMCKTHGNQSSIYAPNGQRWLCRGCTVFCEGGQNEPVGLDEVVRCETCSRHICTHHQSVCAVEGTTHCSKHLRKSDHSGRLVCEAHRDSCDYESNAILASDEVMQCATCERKTCEQHGGLCSVDNKRHCKSHLAVPRSNPKLLLCEKHRATCHVDKAIFETGDVSVCPVCAKDTCQAHARPCRNCGRDICVRDHENNICRTCQRISPVSDPPDALIQAGVVANGGQPIKGASWKTAQDSQHTVVQLDQGWSRKLVFSVRHGESVPQTALKHSMLGSKRVV